MDDAQSLQALVEAMPAAERESYRSYGALNLMSAFPNRRVIVYTLKDGEPEGIEQLLFGGLDMTRTDGCTVSISDSHGEFTVGMVPRRYRKRDVFIHVPQNFTFKWKGKKSGDRNVQFVPHYAVLVKTRSKEIHQVEGHTYCVTLNEFRERWPHLNVRY